MTESERLAEMSNLETKIRDLEAEINLESPRHAVANPSGKSEAEITAEVLRLEHRLRELRASHD